MRSHMQVRYVFSTLSAGTAYTYLEPSGTGLQHTIGIPHVSHPGVAAEAYTSAAAQLQLASLAAHPALGRPNVMVSLPTDVYVNAPVKVAVRQQQTQRAPSTHELPSVMQPPGSCCIAAFVVVCDNELTFVYCSQSPGIESFPPCPR